MIKGWQEYIKQCREDNSVIELTKKMKDVKFSCDNQLFFWNWYSSLKNEERAVVALMRDCKGFKVNYTETHYDWTSVECYSPYSDDGDGYTLIKIGKNFLTVKRFLKELNKG